MPFQMLQHVEVSSTNTHLCRFATSTNRPRSNCNDDIACEYHTHLEVIRLNMVDPAKGLVQIQSTSKHQENLIQLLPKTHMWQCDHISIFQHEFSQYHIAYSIAPVRHRETMPSLVLHLSFEKVLGFLSPAIQKAEQNEKKRVPKSIIKVNTVRG